MAPDTLSDRAKALREAFDRAFASPVESPPASDDVIRVRAGTFEGLLRVSELGLLAVDVEMTPLPASVPGLLGIAGVRGTLLPVYDLGAFAGVPGSGGRWLAVAAGAPVALSFGELAGHARVPRDTIVPRRADAGLPHVHHVAVFGTDAVPVLSVPSIVEAIERGAGPANGRE